MFKYLWHVALLVGAVLTVRADEEAAPTDESVKVLTNDNFDTTITQNEFTLVKFYAPWCGHCKKIAPEYITAAKQLIESGSKVVLADVDATVENELATKLNIQEFPTITFYRKGAAEPYTGGRTAEAIVEWVGKMTGPAMGQLEGEAVDKLNKDAHVAFVGEFKSKDSTLYKTFEEVADGGRSIGPFFFKLGVDEDKIYAIRFDEGTINFGGSSVVELKSFCEEESFPTFGPVNGQNFQKYTERERTMVWMCGSPKDYEDSKSAIRAAAKPLRNTYSFIWLDTDQFKGHAEGALGLTEFPGLVIQETKGRYILPKGPEAVKDENAVIQFLKDVGDGKIEKTLKSDPVPDTNDEPVKVVVGTNMQEMIVQKKKDVFLMVYAPWCGYCKSFEPIYSDFATKIKDLDFVMVAKMDGTTNESTLDEFSWSSFPTIYFLKAGQETPQKYEGARTFDGLMEFLRTNGSGTVPKLEDGEKADKGEEL